MIAYDESVDISDPAVARVPAAVAAAYRDAATYFPHALQLFQFYDKYARFDAALGRRETWPEAVSRVVAFLRELVETNLQGDPVGETKWREIEASIRALQVMPSMRLLAMAGPAARRNNICLYNCAALPVEDMKVFGEAMLISMSGCGVGYSVEHQFVDKLPKVERQIDKGPNGVYWIGDTTEGWVEALNFGVEFWMSGRDVRFDYSKIRPAGTPLRTKGGTASGPAPLRAALDAIRTILLGRQGRKLRPIDAHDIMCWVGQAAVCGGVRRTAMLSLFDPDDRDMLECKGRKFQSMADQPPRWNANNSVVWPEHLSPLDLVGQFHLMAAGGAGEPGIFNRHGLRRHAHRDPDYEYLSNPCGEILLRPYQFCNLSVAVMRPGLSWDERERRVRLAALIGTIQSLALHFPGLRPQWKKNGEEERLLGVDLAGMMDEPEYWRANALLSCREAAIDENEKWSSVFGINQSASVTCVKPSGNSSTLLDVAPGIHPRFAPYYIRNVRVGAATPMYGVLLDAGVPMVPENGQEAGTADTWVASFPVATPGTAYTRRELTALDQCALWLRTKRNYTTHNPSVTVLYESHELPGLINWVWDHREEIGGMAFLPKDDAHYENMPYVEISSEQYDALSALFPEIDFSRLWLYEQSDQTTSAQELACMSGLCSL